MIRNKPNLFIFGWPGFLGGADTKLAHLIPLLGAEFSITVVPNRAEFLRQQEWVDYLRRHGATCCSLANLGRKLDGTALVMCNARFFADGVAAMAKERGLVVAWSNEMMWYHPGERQAIAAGLVDRVLYTSEFQRQKLAPGHGGLPGFITGNYIHPEQFPFSERRSNPFTIGRLSRADPLKYPEDFPVFYECLELPDTRFRVMGWNDELARKYRWHHFDQRWDLLAESQESQVDFLHRLDLFVYPLGHNFQESWGRSTVEAMLTGCVPLVPTGHHFEHLMIHGESGFICRDFTDYRSFATELRQDEARRRRMSRAARDHAENVVCRAEDHIKLWKEALL
jgi:glycosyltransferase involved in cell wall biosynthesis